MGRSSSGAAQAAGRSRGGSRRGRRSRSAAISGLWRGFPQAGARPEEGGRVRREYRWARWRPRGETRAGERGGESGVSGRQRAGAGLLACPGAQPGKRTPPQREGPGGSREAGCRVGPRLASPPRRRPGAAGGSSCCPGAMPPPCSRLGVQLPGHPRGLHGQT